jgi:hypothetical protein
MKLFLLRILLLLDAAVLFLLGALLIFAPAQVERAFHFQDLPPAVSYLIGLWGCALATLGIGYFRAAAHPLRHVVWIQVGIARGALECVLGVVCLIRGSVTLQQAGLGTAIAGAIVLAYCALYPRKPRMLKPAETTGPTQSPA